MPAYFFHLSFELYPPSHPFSRAIPELSLASKADLTSLPAHIPTGSTSGIFSSSLPRHKPPTPPATDAHIRQKSKSKEPLSLSPTSNRAQFAPSSHPDYRFDRISVESIDMPSKKAQPDGGLVPDAASTAASGVPASKARFVPLETKNTEFGYGVVHLYRDTYETPGLYSSALRSELGQSGDGGSETLGDEALTTVAILAVPSYMTALDFLGFVGEETRDAVSHFRMIRTGKANRYMVLMKFREKTRAAMFMKEFNGKVFNSMEVGNSFSFGRRSCRQVNQVGPARELPCRLHKIDRLCFSYYEHNSFTASPGCISFSYQ